MHQRLNNLPRPIDVPGLDQLLAVGFYGDGAGASATKGSKVRIAVTIWNSNGQQSSLDSPNPAAVVTSKTVELAVGAGTFGPLIDTVIVPRTLPWVMKPGAVRRWFGRPSDLGGMFGDAQLGAALMIEVKLLEVH